MAQRFGKYELIKKLGAGGMGEVFLARAITERSPGKSFVLKRILPHLSDNQAFLDLFLNEARICARLHHPNIVQILELGDVDGAWYLLMEHVEGKDLRQVLQTARSRRRALPVGLACRIAADAAAGLDCAHRAEDAQGRPMKIVHRDVSPHNVLLAFDGTVKLIDFGVAKAARRLQETLPGILRGKYPYMSPEQVSTGELDHRSDQFSLAVVLWELLSGQRLFKSDSEPVTLQKVAECKVKPPTGKHETLPAALVETVMRALQKAPQDRFADLGSFRLALEEVLIALRGPSRTADLARWLVELFPARPETTDGAPTTKARPVRSEREVPAMPSASVSPAAWESLAAHEQLALAQLSVFQGGFTIEAAEAVVDLAAVPGAPWALDVVQALRDKSWVRTEATGAHGELRFGLEERLREYARKKLTELGPELTQAAQARHAAWLPSAPRD